MANRAPRDSEKIRQLLWYWRNDTGTLESDIAEEMNINPETLTDFLHGEISVNDNTLNRIHTYLEDKYKERDNYIRDLYDNDYD